MTKMFSGGFQTGWLEQRRTPNFYIIIREALDHGVKIPKRFMERYGDSLKGSVLLKVSGGVKWKVELCKRNGETWLQRGFKQFGEYYSLEKYHFLLFGYLGKSRFSVVIFDSSTSEIEYPVKIPQCDDEDGEIDEDKNEDAGNRWDWVEVNESIEMVEESSAERKIGGRLIQRISGTPEAPVLSSKPSSLVGKKGKLIKPITPSFSFYVQPTQINYPFTLCIPIVFATANFEKDGKLTFRVQLPESGGKSWPVRLCIKGRRAHMYGIGWKRFVGENQLREGEFCTIEMFKEKGVFVFHRRG